MIELKGSITEEGQSEELHSCPTTAIVDDEGSTIMHGNRTYLPSGESHGFNTVERESTCSNRSDRPTITSVRSHLSQGNCEI